MTNLSDSKFSKFNEAINKLNYLRTIKENGADIKEEELMKQAISIADEYYNIVSGKVSLENKERFMNMRNDYDKYSCKSLDSNSLNIVDDNRIYMENTKGKIM